MLGLIMLMSKDSASGSGATMRRTGEAFALAAVANELACGNASGELDMLTQRCNKSYGYLHLYVLGDSRSGLRDSGEVLGLYDSRICCGIVLK